MMMMSIVQARTRRACLALLLAVFACAASLPAAAGPEERLEANRIQQDRLDERQDALARREGALSRRVAVLDRRRARVESQVKALDQHLDRLDSRIFATRNELSNAQIELTGLMEKLVDIQAELVFANGILEERARALYVAGPTAYIDTFLASESFGELHERYAYYKAALRTDAELVEDIEALRTKTESSRNLVEAHKNSIARRKLQLELDRKEVLAIRAERAKVLAERRAIVDAKGALLAKVHGHQARLRDLERQLEAESDRLSWILAGSSTGAPLAGGQFMWPANGPLTSGFGMRVHPIFGDTRMHTGIDIGASYGSSVFAAGAGSVVYTGTLGGYGNVVVIDHGGGLGTTYNHLSAFSVSEGSTVAAGDPVGAVGCTGYCTGPHLHFEVRVNGNPVDPMPYLR